MNEWSEDSSAVQHTDQAETNPTPPVYLREEDLPEQYQSRKRPTLREMLKRKDLDPSKSTQLEKNDMLALIIAAASVFLPVIIGAFLLVALIIMLFT